MTEELEGQAGVGGEGAPTAEPVQPIAPKVDLTELEEFRKYQASVDREKNAARQREAELQKQLAEMQAQQAQIQQQVELAQVQKMEPEEAAAYFQQKLAEERQAYEQRQASESAAAARAAQLQQRADSLLKGLGMSFDTPGLDLSGGATEEGFDLLMASALKLAGQKITGADTDAEEAARKAAQAAQVETARLAGATTVNTSTGPGGEPGDMWGGVKDPIARLSMALESKGGN